MRSQSSTVKPNALVQWEEPAGAHSRERIYSGISKTSILQRTPQQRLIRRESWKYTVGCEATLGLLGRPNATNAGMNIGPTFIPDDDSKAVPMVNPEARTGVHLTPLASSVYVQYVLLTVAI